MNINIGDKCLITTDNYFVAPDGKQYRSVFGTVKAVHDAQTVLGIKPNAKSTNWYVEIGNMILAGCQIHYLVKTDKVSYNMITDTTWGGGIYTTFTRETVIYNADGEQL